MTTSTSSPTPPLSPANEQSLSLSIRNGQAPAELRELKGEKFTLGSSARCDIQLASSHIKPLHCVFSLKEDAWQVTSWAAGLSLNQQPLKSAELSAGDVLVLGEVVIEVLPAEALPEKVTDLEASAVADAPEHTTSLSDTESKLETLTDHINHEFAQQDSAEQADYSAPLQEDTPAAPANTCPVLGTPEPTSANGVAADASQGEEAEADSTDLESPAESSENTSEGSEAATASQPAVNSPLVDWQAPTEWNLSAPSEDQAPQASVTPAEPSPEYEACNGEYAEQETHSVEPATDTAPEIRKQGGVIEQQTFSDWLVFHATTANLTARQRCRNLVHSLRQSRLQADTAQATVSELETKLIEATQQLQGASNTPQTEQPNGTEELQHLLLAAHEQLESARDELKQHQLELNRQAEAYQSLQTAYDAISGSNAFAAPATQEDQQQKQDFSTLLEQRNQELDAVRAELQSACCELANAEEQLAQAKQDYTALQIQHEQQNQELAEVRMRLAEVSEQAKQVETNQDRCTELEQLLSAAEQQLRQLQEASKLPAGDSTELLKLTDERNELASRLATAEEELARLAQVSEQQKAEIDSTRPQGAEANADEQDLVPPHSSAVAELGRLGQELAAPATSTSSEESLTPVLVEAPTLNELSDEQSRDEATTQPVEEQVEPVTKGTDFFNAPAKPATDGPKTTSFIEQYSHLLDENEEAEPEPVSTAKVNRLLEGEPVGTQDHAASVKDEEDDALQNYMASMMNRVRGQSDSPSNPGPAAPSPSHSSSAPTAATAAAVLPEPVQSVEPICMDELRQASSKPPLASDLGALRALANSSARKAIATSRQRRHYEMAISKFLICVIAAATAGYLTYSAKSYTSVYFVGGLIAAIAFLYFGFQLLGCLLRAVRDGSWEGKVAEPTITQTMELPISGIASRPSA